MLAWSRRPRSIGAGKAYTNLSKVYPLREPVYFAGLTLYRAETWVYFSGGASL